ncbi:WxL domain-containing protein [endosymbiont 'TC1' of Trimyema compressum]|uniref:WxL domain-containing protein n=1 Tax=endosymbiont 'TC1' of Trimyema compressum TaxID=243899 RepID=UPI001FE172BA|nr:WxL domain-containing protein [endosymbiont 'TC1' of Trimyema compressum]
MFVNAVKASSATLPNTTTYTAHVTDERGGINGYKLTVQALTGMISYEEDELHSIILDELDGGNIKLIKPTLVQDSTTAGIGTEPLVFNGSGTIYADNFNLGVAIPSTVLSTSHLSDQGLLGWAANWTGDKITLNVKAGEAKAGDYLCTLTWSLADVP